MQRPRRRRPAARGGGIGESSGRVCEAAGLPNSRTRLLAAHGSSCWCWAPPGVPPLCTWAPAAASRQAPTRGSRGWRRRRRGRRGSTPAGAAAARAVAAAALAAPAADPGTLRHSQVGTNMRREPAPGAQGGAPAAAALVPKNPTWCRRGLRMQLVERHGTAGQRHGAREAAGRPRARVRAEGGAGRGRDCR